MLAQMTSAGRLEYHICDADFAGGFGCRHFLCVFFAAYFPAYCKKLKRKRKYNMEKTEYEKGYEAGYHDGAKDCQKLYSKILDYICSMFQEKKEDKEKECKGQIDGCKEKQKMIEKIISGRPDRPMILNKPIDGSLKVGDIVFTKSHVVLDVGFVKSTFPLRIYSRSTKYDFGGVPGEVELTFGRVNYYKLYYSGVNMSLDKWKEISLDASAEEVCKKIGISYRRE